MPFVGFACSGDKRLTIRDIKIIGNPTIPREVNLISENDMRGWNAKYFNLVLPTSEINRDKRDQDAGAPRAVRTRPKMSDVKKLSWTVKDGEIISGSDSRKPHQEQYCLQYQRPLCDGETLTYEFFYEPGKIEVHPSIGRIAYMLRDDGCKLHWMNAGGDLVAYPAGF